MKIKIKNEAIADFLIVFGILLMMWPITIRVFDKMTVSNSVNDFKKEVVEIAKERAKELERGDTTDGDNQLKDLDELYQLMKKYNWDLYKNGQEVSDAFSYESSSFDLRKYGFKENVVAVLNIPKLNVKLPVYLGTTAENLNKGAAHLTSTSLPLGETNSNVVIAAHRGLVKHQMFRNIDKLEVGDKITLTTIWDFLEYKVTGKEIISPTDSSKIYIQEGKDMVTLITCHPYRVNTHRYVVYCERTTE